MRDIERSIARHLMELHGVKNINRKKFRRKAKSGKIKTFQDLQDKMNEGKKVSFFALHWKEYLDPESSYRKDMERQLKRDALLQTKKYGKPVTAPWPVPR